MKGVRLATLWVMAAACVMGCGYKLQGTGASPFLPDHIRIIDLETFDNKTTRPEIEQRVTEQVAIQFSRRGQYRVVTTRDGADALFEGTITDYRTEAVEFNVGGRATRLMSIVTLQATLRDLANDEVLWSQSGMQFRETFDVPETGTFFDEETLAIDEIAREAAGSLVSSILEGF